MRLAALKEAPYAFGSTYANEEKAREDRWRQALEDRTRFVAEVDAVVAGTISVGPATWSKTAAITAMWVDPRFRRRGFGELLVRHALAWARENNHEQVFLWVTEVNVNAERLYRRIGFVRTGGKQEVRAGEVEYEMEYRV